MRRSSAVFLPLLMFLAACGPDGEVSSRSATPPGGGSLMPPGSEIMAGPFRPTSPDPNAWARFFVTAFDEEKVASLRRTAAFAQHTIRIGMRIAGHPTYDTRRTVEVNPLVEARIDYAHSVGLTGRGQVVSMLDSAPRVSHEQFAGKTIYTTGSGPEDGHGTAVAALMAGTGGAGQAIGVAPRADLHFGVMDFDRGNSWTYLAGVMRDARALGAVVSNNSWSMPEVSVANTDLRAHFQHSTRIGYIRALREFTETGVVVFAAGNDYHAKSVSGMAGLPTAFPDLEGRWLAVVNAIPQYDAHRILSAERVSTACLEAARWCLAANGQARVASEQGDDRYRLGSGSSYAAPQVSGSIALLAEAFPTLTAGQLRDRLLASADNSFFAHSGVVEFAPGIHHGYNEEFGHGFLDMRAALLPIGKHVMPVVSGGVRDADQVALISGAATGDAVARSLEAARVISLDWLHGTFETDARHLAATSAGRHDHGMMQARAASRGDVPIFSVPEAHALDGGLHLPEIASGLGSLRVTLPNDDAEVSGLSVRQSLEAGPGELTIGLGVGVQSDGIMGLRVPSSDGHLSGRTASATLDYDFAVGSSGRLGFTSEFGVASGRAAGMVERIGGVRFNAFSLRYTIGDVAAKGDSLSLAASRPVALTSGQATMTLPVAMSDGSPVFQPMALGLAPTARQFDLAVEYSRPVGKHASLRLGALHSSNQGHRAGVRETSGVLGLSMRF
jgi:subtilase-type serine protease